VNVKKGQWMAPEEMRGAVARCAAPGAAGVAVTERGTFFGYGNLVVDMRSFALMREAAAPAIFDGTHSVQRPGRARASAAASRASSPRWCGPRSPRARTRSSSKRTRSRLGAPSDTTNMLPLDRLRPLLEEVLALRAALGARRAA
jgi:2-dehydro-3-deoxyphosphooctonate aldolase (KDO 8-P synthase)